MIRLYGALKPKVDVRDYKVAAAVQEFPENYLCGSLPPVKNQRSVNSCVAHATAAILETFNKVETGKYISLSTNFIYGMQGIEFNRLDSGMYLRDACKIVHQYGDATERAISGNTEQPNCTEELKNKLNGDILNEAIQYCVKSYAKCKTSNDIKYALMNHGPVLANIKWYKKYGLKNKIVTFDKSSDFGYHAIIICGWNELGWICQNSWGRNWNTDGRFIYPYNEKFVEIWSFIDENKNDIKAPKNNNWLNYIYKLLNLIINIFRGKR